MIRVKQGTAFNNSKYMKERARGRERKKRKEGEKERERKPRQGNSWNKEKTSSALKANLIQAALSLQTHETFINSEKVSFGSPGS